MANEFVQTMSDARVDARSLSDFVFKPAGFKVPRRLAPPIDTLQFYIDRFNSLNGDFSSSVSVALSSLNNSVAEADGKVAYIETTVQDAINNTAVEGGVLAATFVTVEEQIEGEGAISLRALNQRTAITVESIEELLKVNKTNGRAVFVKSYFSGNGNGGGSFIYDSSVARNRHDGGAIIDPTRTFPTNWGAGTGLAAWFAAGGTGAGCFVRKASSVCFEDFGALGNKTQDDSYSLNACFRSGLQIVEAENRVYGVDNQLTIPTGTSYTGHTSSSVWSRIDDSLGIVGAKVNLTNFISEDSGLPNAKGLHLPLGTPSVIFTNPRIQSQSHALTFDANGGSGFVAFGGVLYTRGALGVVGAVKVLGNDVESSPRKFYGTESGGCTLYDFGGASSIFIYGGYTNGLIFSSSDANKVFISKLRVGAAGGDVLINGTSHVFEGISFASPKVTFSENTASCLMYGSVVGDYNIVDLGANNRFDTRKLTAVSLLDSAANIIALPTSVLRALEDRKQAVLGLSLEFTLKSPDVLPSGQLFIKLPYKVDSGINTLQGTAIFTQASTGYSFSGTPYIVRALAGTTDVIGIKFFKDTSIPVLWSKGAPFAWADNDKLELNISVAVGKSQL